MTNGNDELLKRARDMDRDVEYNNTQGEKRGVTNSGNTKANDSADRDSRGK